MAEASAETTLRNELDAFARERRRVPLWWRDDDAVEPSAALDRLLRIARRHGLPLALAVVPLGAREGLAARLADEPAVSVLQHGSAHRNHAAPGGRAVECGGDRAADAVLAELSRGRAILEDLFPGRFLPVIVPPWNRIEPRIADRLAGEGWRGLSTFGPVAEPRDDGLAAVNAHLDILRWKGGAHFAGRDKLLLDMACQLAERRAAGSDEPFGVLTHHLDHDEESWAFLDELLGLLAAHPAARWIGAAEAFGLPGSEEAGR